MAAWSSEVRFLCVLTPGVLHWCVKSYIDDGTTFIQFSALVPRLLPKATSDHPSLLSSVSPQTVLCTTKVTQKPTWPIQSGQSGRDGVEYDLEEIDRELFYSDRAELSLTHI